MSTPVFDPARSPATVRVSWDPATADDPRLREIHAYWESRRGGRRMPSRAEIDPASIPRLLPYLVLVDVLDEPRDFRFRLAGTHFGDVVGRDVTGLRIGEALPPAFHAETHYHWSNCVERRAPLVGIGRLWLPARDFIDWKGILLPLSADGASVNMILGGIVFSSP